MIKTNINDKNISLIVGRREKGSCKRVILAKKLGLRGNTAVVQTAMDESPCRVGLGSPLLQVDQA